MAIVWERSLDVGEGGGGYLILAFDYNLIEIMLISINGSFKSHKS